ncbi:MAG: hypothetical protein LLG06_09360 [Desulfobacteraceae bacterium]|nr:hypothetical protein [Desulfobacteraceae bacterium]
MKGWEISGVQGNDLNSEEARRDIGRANARLRHFRGIAAIVINDAFKIWESIWESMQDSRTWEQILDGSGDPPGPQAQSRAVLLERLHLLGIQIDYARRLCEGAVEEGPRNGGEV